MRYELVNETKTPKKKPKTKSISKKNLEKTIHEAKYYKKRFETERKKNWDEDKIVRDLKEVLYVTKPLKPYPRTIPQTEHTKQDLILLFGDCQVGEKIQTKETGYLDYNIDVFKERLQRLYTSVLNITERHRKDFEIDTLNVFMLGDLVEGDQIFRGQGSRIVTDVVEQMFEGQEAIHNFIRSLSRYYDKIDISTIPGNHGRKGRKDEDLTYVNFDYIIHKNLEQMFSKDDKVKFHVDKRWWRIKEVQGWKFYMEHGDRIKKYWSIPWYGTERADNRTLKMMRAMDKDYDYFIIGHHHTPFEWDANRGERICNGTFSSGNPYAMRDLKVLARPTQKLFGVHKEVGITFRYNVRLDLPEEYIK